MRVALRLGLRARQAAWGGRLDEHVPVLVAAEGGLVAQLDGDRLQGGHGAATGCEGGEELRGVVRSCAGL